MTQRVIPGARSGAVRADPSRGQIPFRLRIGVTGHPDLPPDPALGALVSSQLSQLIELVEQENATTLARLMGPLGRTKPTVVELTVISSLASAADRLIVRELLAFAGHHQQQARLEVVLPAHRTAHADAQNWDAATRNEFYQHLDQASVVTELGSPEPARRSGGEAHHEGGQLHGSSGPGRGSRGPAHLDATRRLLASCDILLVLWDGKYDDPGGTAEILLEAASLRKPCIWISTGPGHRVTHNFGRGQSYRFQHMVANHANVPPSRARPLLEPEDPRRPDDDVLSPVRESLRLLSRYNAERLPPQFEHRLKAEFPDAGETWIGPHFLRATMLAGQYQTRFTRSAQAISILAIIAAAVLGVHLTLNSSSVWDWAEVGSLVVLTAVFIVLNRLEFHDRWISYRVLAERLRSARFLIPAGVDFPIFQRAVTAYIERHPSDWIQRTFDEFWQSERERRKEYRSEHPGEATRRSPDRNKELADRLADRWIGAQIAYHHRRHAEHQRWQRLLLATILVLFAAAVVCAVLDACAVDRDLTGFLSVLLPAAAASLGALLTVRQHRQLAERSDQVSRDLEEARWQIKHADGHRMIVSTAARAARIMAEENEDWLGALWFLDVEHPG